MSYIDKIGDFAAADEKNVALKSSDGRSLSKNAMTIAEALENFSKPEEFSNKIQLIRPFGAFSAKAYSTATTLPIGIAYLAAMLEKAGYDVDIIDGIGEDILNVRTSADGQFLYQGLSIEAILDRLDPNTSIVGVSMMFSQNWVQYKELIEAIRQHRPDVTIIVGGEHATALPDATISTCPAIDYLVTGEGELTFLEIVYDLSLGRPATNLPGVYFRDSDGAVAGGGLGPRILDVKNIPWPAWHLCPVENYFTGMWSMGIGYGRNMIILATRGCPYQCTFCSNPTMWTTRYLMRDPTDVVDEIEFLVNKYSCNSVDFADLTAIVKKDWILEFCDELERRQLNVGWQLPSGTRSEALDENIVRRLYETGCKFLVYAPESGSEETLKKIKKQVNPNKLLESLRQAIAIGHTTKVCTIIGFPHERRKNILQTLLYAIRLAWYGVDDCNISPYSPYPGSELFEELRAEGAIPELDERYFLSLLGQFDFTSTANYCRHVPGWEIAVYRFTGMALFYSLSYIFHPSRLVRLIRYMFKETFEPRSLFEQRIYDFFGRKKLSRG